MTKTTSLYEAIGEETIRKVVAEFYRRAFEDPMIRHFFIRSDIEHLIAEQSDFAIGMLGGPKRYRGKPLFDAHLPFTIRAPHFGRRQMLMREVLDDFEVAPELRDGWLALEEKLKPLIVNA